MAAIAILWRRGLVLTATTLSCRRRADVNTAVIERRMMLTTWRQEWSYYNDNGQKSFPPTRLWLCQSTITAVRRTIRLERPSAEPQQCAAQRILTATTSSCRRWADVNTAVIERKMMLTTWRREWSYYNDNGQKSFPLTRLWLCQSTITAGDKRFDWKDPQPEPQQCAAQRIARQYNKMKIATTAIEVMVARRSYCIIQQLQSLSDVNGICSIRSCALRLAPHASQNN
jgi:hypothetical protein